MLKCISEKTDCCYASFRVAQIVPVVEEPDLVVTSGEEEEIDLEAEPESYQISWQGKKKKKISTVLIIVRHLFFM